MGILHDQTSYKMENFVVREFGGTKYLSMGSESKFIPIEEIKDAKSVAKDYESMLEGAQIVAVSQFGSYKACMCCGARVEPSADNSFGRCSIQDCMMLQKVDFCTVHKLMLMAKSTLITLSIHGKLLQNLTNTKTDSEVTEGGLLSLPPLKEGSYL